jgi:PAS domain S-box-containing protein
MDVSEFSKRLAAWALNVQHLKQRLEVLAPEQNGLFEEAMEETLTAYEELRVADEELRVQHDTLEATRELVEQERERYQALFEFAPDAYLVTDGSGVIREANHAAALLFQRAQQYLPGKPLITFIALDRRQLFRQRLQQASTASVPQRWEEQLQPTNQAVIDVNITVSSTLETAGKGYIVRWLIRDITAQKQLERELQQARVELEQRVDERTTALTETNAALQTEIVEHHQTEAVLFEVEEYLRMMFENITDYAIFSMDMDNRIQRWNLGAERLFGFAEAEAIGQTGGIIFTPEDRAHGVVEQELVEALAHGYARDERWHQRKDGSRLFVSGVMRLMHDQAGKRRGFIKVTQDITQRKQAEAMLQQAHEQTQQLAALEERQRIARDLHDAVNQTLFTSSLLSEALLQHEALPDTLQSSLRELYRLNKGALAEMRTLLLALRPEHITRMELVTQLQQLIDATRARKRIDFTLNATIEQALPPEVHLAFYRIAQEAFNNLIKHSNAKTVEVAFSSTIRGVELRISDDGVGFDASTGSKGMGLTNMHERAHQVGATLTISSTLGQGTSVRVNWRPPQHQ